MYYTFLQEAHNEAMMDMMRYISEEEASDLSWYESLYTEKDEADEKIVFIENYYLRDNLVKPYISGLLKKPKIREAIVDFTGEFIDDHTDELNTSGPVKMIIFGTAEVEPLYRLFNITADQVLDMYYKMIEETYPSGISKFITGWIQNAPHKLFLTAILIDALQNGYDDVVTCMEYLHSFSVYPVLFREYWKLGVKEDVMNYTIEHLGSKFQVKKVGNLLALLKYDSTNAVEYMQPKLIIGDDHIYIDFIRTVYSRINSKMKNISRAYYDNIESNASQHDKTTQFDDGKLADQDGITTNIASIVDNTINKYIVGDINNSLAGIAAEANKVDKNTLITYITQINTSKGNMINKFIENVITIFFLKNPSAESLTSSSFVSFGLSLYRSISMSKDELYMELKQVLNHWMFDIINIKEYYQREATIINYTRAIYNYMIFMINYYN